MKSLNNYDINTGKWAGLVCTEVSAEWLFDDLGLPNGCGNSRLTRALSNIVQKVLGVDLNRVCNLHDQCYSIPYELRTEAHRACEDTNFEDNLTYAVNNYTARVPEWLWNISSYRSLHKRLIKTVPSTYHRIVTVGGSQSYWSV